MLLASHHHDSDAADYATRWSQSWLIVMLLAGPRNDSDDADYATR